MIPVTYKMIDLNGLDLATINGGEVTGIYEKIGSAFSTSRIAILCNWFFAGILIVPSYVLISEYSSTEYRINDVISVKSNDTVTVIGIIPHPIIEELNITENGTYIPSGEVVGFSPVEVDVRPVLSELSVTENGSYTPEQGVDGFSSVGVNVQPVLVQLTTTQNGTFTPEQGVDGFSSVSVNVETATLVSKEITSNGTYNPASDNADGYSSVLVAVPPVLVSDNFCTNWDLSQPINTSGQSSYSGNVNAIDGWSLYRASMQLVSGGIIVEKTTSEWGGSLQRLPSSLVSYFSGKTMTCSIIINGHLYYKTFTYPTTANAGSTGIGENGNYLRIFRTSGNVTEITIDASPSGRNNIISAIKLEFGSVSTLATNVNGSLIINQPFNQDAEKLKQAILL